MTYAKEQDYKRSSRTAFNKTALEDGGQAGVPY